MKHERSKSYLALTVTSLALIGSVQIGFCQLNYAENTISGTYSSAAGGVDNVVGGDYSTIGGGEGNSLAADRSFIGSGYGNYVLSPAVYSIICGGYDNGIYDYYGFIGGGALNKVYSTNGTIVAGAGNVLATNALGSFIGAGYYNTISNAFGTVGGGYGNVAAAKDSTIPGGREAKTKRTGQFAMANGKFSAPGDAQMSVYIFRGVTTDANWTELFLDGSSERLGIPANASWLCDIQVVSRGTVTQNNMRGNYWRQEVAIENTGGTTVGSNLGNSTLTSSAYVQSDYALQGDPDYHNHFVYIPQLSVQVTDASASLARSGLAFSAAADNTHDALTISVKGNASETVHWVVTVRTTELIKP
jgi:hypothetical protein